MFFIPLLLRLINETNHLCKAVAHEGMCAREV